MWSWGLGVRRLRFSFAYTVAFQVVTKDKHSDQHAPKFPACDFRQKQACMMVMAAELEGDLPFLSDALWKHVEWQYWVYFHYYF